MAKRKNKKNKKIYLNIWKMFEGSHVVRLQHRSLGAQVLTVSEVGAKLTLV